MVSLLKHGKFYGVKLMKNEILDISQYKQKFGYPLTIENDTRFSNRNFIIQDNHESHCVYLNFLDEDIDYVATYENLNEDMKHIQKTLKINENFNTHVEKSNNRNKNYRSYYNDKVKEEVRNLYYKDIDCFGYKF